LVTAPSESLAVALMSRLVGAMATVLLAGLVMETAGGVLVLRHCHPVEA